MQSLRNISRIDLGLHLDNVITFSVSPELNGYTHLRSRQFFQSLEQELAAIPGVTDASAAMVPLLAGNSWGNDVNVQGFKKGPDTDAGSRFNEAGPGYFRTVGIPIVAGREFTPSDVSGAPQVAVVNQAFAKKFGLGQDAVGKYMNMGSGDSLNIQIVGLVKDAKYSDVKQVIPPIYFLPYKQDTTIGSVNFYLRTASDPLSVLRAMGPIVKRLDPNLPVQDLKTMPQQVRESVFLDRMIGTLSLSFALLATLLAAIGLYGVLAYSVAQRTREIGVRMALGADAARVHGMVLRQVGLMTLIGGAIGIAGAIALGRSAQSLLFGLQGFNPLAIAGAAVVLSLVAFGAGYIPARRASQIHPMQALRYE